ncbi:MAG: hypothetical protein V5A31_07425 [Haloferacaceae archaeon]|jgi:rubrerythrin
MIALLQRLRHWVADEPVVYECRHCGTTLDGRQDVCPACGADDVVAYDLE